MRPLLGLVTGAVVVAVAAVVPSSAAVGSDDPGVGSYRTPVSPVVVVRPFVAPAGPYGPGHRGVDLKTSPGQAAVAASAGVVGFAGRVAGRGLVTVRHPDGVVTEYEPVRPLVHAGQAVASGAALGTVAGAHGGCRPGGCVHWSARRDGLYLDPMTLLEPLGPVRLVPW